MKMKLKSAFSLFLEKTLFNFVFSIHKVKLYKSAIICFVFLGPKLHAISHTILSISFMIFFKSISSIKLEIFNTMQDYPEVFFILYFSIFYFRYSDPFLLYFAIDNIPEIILNIKQKIIKKSIKLFFSFYLIFLYKEKGMLLIGVEFLQKQVVCAYFVIKAVIITFIGAVGYNYFNSS